MYKSVLLVIVSVFFILGPSSALFGQQPLNIEQDDLLEIIPSEVVFILKVNRFGTTLSRFDEFLTGISPLSLSMMMRMQLQGLLNDPDLNNVNLNGSFAVFAIENPEWDPEDSDSIFSQFALIACIPITNFNEFVEQNPNCSEPDENDIASIVTKDMAGESFEILITHVDGYGFFTFDEFYDVLAVFRENLEAELGVGVRFISLGEHIEDFELEKSFSESVWIYLNLPEIPGNFISSMSQQFPMENLMMTQQQIDEFETSLGEITLVDILRSFWYMSLSLTPSDERCILSFAVGVEPESVLAPWFDPEKGEIKQILELMNAQTPNKNSEQLRRVSTFISNVNDLDYMGQYNLLDIFTLAAQMSPEMPQLPLTAKSSLTYTVEFDGEITTITLAVPKEHFIEFAAASAAIQQQMLTALPTADTNDPNSTTGVSKLITVGAPESVITIDGLSFGMTKAQMIGTLGPPKSSTANMHYYFDKGLTTITSKKGLVAEFICGSINPNSPLVKNCIYKTSSHIGIGSTKQEIIQAYGRPYSESNYPLSQDTETIEYENINARFTLAGDKVIQMIFRAPQD